MNRVRYPFVLTLALIIVLTSCGGATPTRQGSSTPTRQSTPSQSTIPTTQSSPSSQITVVPQGAKLQHIFYIVMENHAANQIFGNTADAPYLNQLAATYGVATNYFGVTHPSLPNYLAAISGDFQGIWDDCPADATVTCAPQAFGSSLTSDEVASASNRSHMFNSQTIVDQLETHHMTWKAYMQSMPSPGFTGASYGAYAQKHDPFMYFTDIRNNASRMERIVPFTQFNQDVQSGDVPNFAWISPDECNDMHGTPNCASYDGLISLGDTFVRTIVQNITQSSAWKEGSAIVIVWDENDIGASGCCKSPTGVNGATLGGADVPIIVMTSNGPRHIVLNTTLYNHYSLLATIERIWNLGCLANTCGFSDAALMTKLFA